MGNPKSREAQGCTSAQKRLCQRFATLFELNSELCGHRGDDVSARAWKYIAGLMQDVAEKGPAVLEGKILERKEQISKCHEDE